MDRQRTIQRDYKSPLAEPRTRRRITHHHLLTLAGVMMGVGIVIGFLPHDAEATRSAPVSLLEPVLPDMALEDAAPSLPLPLPESAASGDPAPAPTAQAETPAASASAAVDDAWRTVTIKPGDSLSLIFGRNGISARELHQLMSLGDDTRALTRILPGKDIRLLVGDEGNLEALTYDIGEARTLEVRRTDAGFAATTVEHEVERRVARASGTISDSLFLTASRAGLSDNLTMALAGIFGWDIDFSLDIRQDDRFSVIYEELYLHGEKLRDGRILAAEFVNRGKVHRAIHYTDAEGRADYYAPNGDSMRKAFLRSPVDFSRVSSRFNLNRRHPVLNTIRAHRGVDYAAPTGTPIRATGDGRITLLGNHGGYGKTVVIQHGSRYSTLYAHMSGYARGLRQGSTVKQGQIIGYIGMTGLATGPHLHYEFQVDGVHRDPLTVKLPDASPLPAKYRQDFERQSQSWLASLDEIDRMYASLPERDGVKILDAGPLALSTLQ